MKSLRSIPKPIPEQRFPQAAALPSIKLKLTSRGLAPKDERSGQVLCVLRCVFGIFERCVIVHVWHSRRGGANAHLPQIRVRSFAEASAQQRVTGLKKPPGWSSGNPVVSLAEVFDEAGFYYSGQDIKVLNALKRHSK